MRRCASPVVAVVVPVRYEAIVVKFCTQVGYVKSQHTDDKWPLKGRGHVTHFKFLSSQWYLWNGLS